MSRKILLIGGGGHCKSVLDTLLELHDYDEIGIIDKKEYIGTHILGVPVIGCDDDLQFLFNNGYKHGFITVGSIGNPVNRIKLYNLISKIGFEIPNIIDKSATVSRYAKLENGVFVGKKSIVNAESLIQKGCIINSASVIEHECKIGSFVHVAPGVVLGGEVEVGDNTHIGSNSVIKQQIRIGTNSIIGMGSVVVKNINSQVLAYGNPCVEVERL